MRERPDDVEAVGLAGLAGDAGLYTLDKADAVHIAPVIDKKH